MSWALSAGAALGLVWILLEINVRVDEPQFAYRYSRIAFVLGLSVILCICGTIAAAAALLFRAQSDD